MSGESRQDLLTWLNELLQLGYTKIEQCGSGAAHCQIMDSIFRNVPLGKVKFNAKQEYEYVKNFKILQGIFDKHKIDNAIPVERLIKCKFQDNLEFLQLVKKYWDQYYPGGSYDAISRRKGVDASGMTTSSGGLAIINFILCKDGSWKGGGGNVNSPMKKSTSSDNAMNNAATLNTSSGGYRTSATRVLAKSSSSSPAGSNISSKMVDEMLAQNNELKVTVEQVEKEREFYFSKLREIELFVQTTIDGPMTSSLDGVLKEIQGIMYRTEDGFEVPADDETEMF